MAENNKQATPQDQEQDLSQVLKVRRDKLAALQKEGKDPFQQHQIRPSPTTPRRSKSTLTRWRARP